MTYYDFFKMLEDTGSMIISKELFHTLLESQMPKKLTAVEKKKIYDDAYELGYSTAKVERQGHWIKHKHNGMEYIECSNCYVWFMRMHLLHNSYCPNCGQKMLGNEDRECGK